MCILSVYGEQQVKTALMIFLVSSSCPVAIIIFAVLCCFWNVLLLYSQFCQLGSFSIHIALRNLKQPGELMRPDDMLFSQDYLTGQYTESRLSYFMM